MMVLVHRQVLAMVAGVAVKIVLGSPTAVVEYMALWPLCYTTIKELQMTVCMGMWWRGVGLRGRTMGLARALLLSLTDQHWRMTMPRRKCDRVQRDRRDSDEVSFMPLLPQGGRRGVLARGTNPARVMEGKLATAN